MKVDNGFVRFAAGREFESRIPGARPRQNCVFTGDDGKDYVAWFNAGEPKYCQLRKGDRVQWLVDDSKGKEKITLIEPEPPEPEAIDVEAHEPAPIVAQPPAAVEVAKPQLTPEQKQATRDLQMVIVRRARVISSCHAQVASQFTNDRGELLIHPGEIQKYATALFISLREDGLLDRAGM